MANESECQQGLNTRGLAVGPILYHQHVLGP